MKKFIAVQFQIKFKSMSPPPPLIHMTEKKESISIVSIKSKNVIKVIKKWKTIHERNFRSLTIKKYGKAENMC